MKKFLCFLLISFFINNIFAQIEEMSPMPERVTNNAVVEGFVNGVPYVYSFAGLDSTKLYSGIHLRSYRYNTQTDTWESIPDLPDDMGKIAASTNRIGDIIYIIGGYHVFSNGSEVSSEKVHRYNTQTNEYMADGASIPVPIDDQVQAVWRDSLIYVVTGWSNSQNVTNVQIYNPATDQWMQGTPVPNNSVYPVFGAAGVILDDTIYYYGGARNGNFNITQHVRKGVINPDDPTEVSWSASVPDFDIPAYRPAAFLLSNSPGIFWIGGSDNTYNYNGIAYNNGQGVEPNHRLFYYDPILPVTWNEQYYPKIPMDLRGIANFDTVQYIVGGMESNQLVSNKTLKLSNFPLIVNTKELENENFSIEIAPNPVRDLLSVIVKNGGGCDHLRIRIFNIEGKLMLEKSSPDCEIMLDVKHLNPGLYQLSILEKGRIFTKRFVKAD